MKLGRNNRFNQDYTTLRHQCIVSGVLFEDELFPATNASLYEEGSKYLKGTKNPYFSKWLRPTEFCKEPKFLKNGCSKYDIKQGHCKDCWFLAAITNLTSNKKLLFKVVRADNTFDPKCYAGIFHFKFWQYGEWIDVVIDDRLPTYTANNDKTRLSYAHSSDEDEFWSALLEKAFAKIHGSYEALGKCGTFCEAAEDITGGVGQKFCIKYKEHHTDCHVNCYYNSITFCQLEKNFKMGSFMSCFIRKQQKRSNEENSPEELKTPEKLVKAHSFAITSIIRTKNDGQLIKLKNPWGHYEWNGAWSDRSKEWKQTSEIMRKKLQFRIADDGEFFMSYEDFYFRFDVVEICYLKFPYSLLEMKSQETYFISIARKHPRLLPDEKIIRKSLLSLELNSALTVSFEEFKKMVNFIALNSETTRKKYCQIKRNNVIPLCPRTHYQWNGSQMNLIRLTSHEEELFIRLFICCQMAHSAILKCISVHIRIVENCIELYKPECKKIINEYK